MLASEGGHVAGSSASCHAVLRPSLTRHAPRQRTDGPGWEQIADLLPHHPRQGGRWRCHRTVINAVIRKPEELPSPHVTGHFLSPVNVTAEHQPVDRAETERASRFVTLPPAPRWGRDTATAVTPLFQRRSPRTPERLAELLVRRCSPVCIRVSAWIPPRRTPRR